MTGVADRGFDALFPSRLRLASNCCSSPRSRRSRKSTRDSIASRSPISSERNFFSMSASFSGTAIRTRQNRRSRRRRPGRAPRQMPRRLRGFDRLAWFHVIQKAPGLFGPCAAFRHPRDSSLTPGCAYSVNTSLDHSEHFDDSIHHAGAQDWSAAVTVCQSQTASARPRISAISPKLGLPGA